VGGVTSPETIGLVAGSLTTVAFVPQVVRIVRTRSADDISWWMFGLFSLGVAMWLWYGLATGAVPVIAANVATLGLATAVLVLKWGYGRRRPAAERAAHDGDAPSQAKE
jgi:MtN3 and saliva related transmembrane protein